MVPVVNRKKEVAPLLEGVDDRSLKGWDRQVNHATDSQIRSWLKKPWSSWRMSMLRAEAIRRGVIS